MADEIRVLTIEEAKGQGNLTKLVRGGVLSLVGEASYGPEALSVAQDCEPDVIVVSLEEPLARSLRTIENLSVALPNRGIIAIATSQDRDVTRRAVRAGARDYLTMPVGRDDVQRAIIAVHEAEHKRQQLGQGDAHRSLASGELFVVFGAKGGIGKTTVAVNLATAIATETKERVALIDLDVQMGDVALMLNINPERSIADAALQADRLEPDVLQSLVYADSSGVRILPSPATPETGSLITAAQVDRVLEVLLKTFDYVVVDTSPSLNDLNLAAIEKASTTLILAAPELSSLKRTKIALRLLLEDWSYPPDRLKLVVNHPSPLAGVTPGDIESALNIPIFWQVPYDVAVADSVRAGRSCIESRPMTRYSRSMVDLARSLCGIHAPTKGLLDFLRRGR